jgi:hypothetical protein
MNILIEIAAAQWLITIVACVFALYWSCIGNPRRFWLGVILTISAIVSSYLGLTRFHITGSQTVNGQLQWRLDSNWFFTASLVLGVLALALTLWKRWRSIRAA